MNGITTQMKKAILLVAILIIAISSTLAEDEGEFVLPEIERKSLLNGMQFLFFNGGYGKAPFILMIENGAAFDPADRWGATYLMCRMMFEKLSTPQWEQEFANRGIQLDFLADFDALYFYGVAPEGEMEFALSTLADVLVDPDFSEDDFSLVRGRVLEEMQEKMEAREELTQFIFQDRLFQENPYGHPVMGTPETLESLYLRDVKIQARRLLMPNQAKLALYYNGDRDRLFRLLSPRWGSWVRDEAAPFTFRQTPPIESARITILEEPGAETALMRCGYLGVSKNSREYITLKVLEQYILLTLPEWAEEVSSVSQIRGSAELVARKMPGYLQVNFQASPDEVRAYFDHLIGLLQDLLEAEIDPARFAEAKTLVYQEFLNSFQDPLKGAREILETDLYQLGINYLTTFHLRLERISPDVFTRMMESSLSPEKFVMVVSGPAEKFASISGETENVEILK